ncbi:metal-dependent hydrolase, partial [Ligilactobacillus salivarius]
SLIFGREASGFNHWRNSPRLVKVDSRRLLS